MKLVIKIMVMMLVIMVCSSCVSMVKLYSVSSSRVMFWGLKFSGIGVMKCECMMVMMVIMFSSLLISSGNRLGLVWVRVLME